jgi:class 3 adenylate cyclase/Flp pilus assembly protein TadD
MDRIRYLFFFLAVLLDAGNLPAQQQQVADSLEQIYLADTLYGEAKLELLRNLAFHHTNSKPDKSLKYADELIALAGEMENQLYLFRGYYLKGNTYSQQDNLDEALASVQYALELAQQDGNFSAVASTYMLIGTIYYDSGEIQRAVESFDRSISIYRDPKVYETLGGVSALGDVLTNVGYVYLDAGEYKKAEDLLDEAAEIYTSIDDKKRLTYVRGNQGILNVRLGNYNLAEQYLTEVIPLLEEDGNFEPVAEYQASLAEVYLNRGEFKKAHKMAEEGLFHAQRLGMKDQINKSSLLLAKLDYELNNFKEAYGHLNLHMQYKDSMDTESVDIARLERDMADLEREKLDGELELQNQKQKQQRAALWAIGATALLLIFIVLGGYGRYRYIKRTNRTISAERDRSEELLLNILPKETAQELKDNGHVLAKRFESVTVLFTDFKGFTAHAESLDPEKLVESIDLYFSNFDTIMEKYGLEKIKTVGDAYMCASGLPFPSEDHAHRMAEAALELIEFVEEAKTKAPDDLIHFDIRVGINSGPVVAGVVGTKKFAYDIWGDTVNIASRMESASEAGRINIAEETYQLLKDDYECEYRGKIDVKNRGKLNMYFMLGRKAQSKTA